MIIKYGTDNNRRSINKTFRSYNRKFILKELSSLEDLYGFCQFGGHNPNIPRKKRLEELTCQSFADNDNTASLWLVCKDCSNYFAGGDLTMNVLHNWATEGIADITNQLPNSLRENPLRQSLLIQYVDEFLNNNTRKILGNRFPTFLADLNESEKKYFIRELEQDPTIRDVFLHDVKDCIKVYYIEIMGRCYDSS